MPETDRAESVNRPAITCPILPLTTQVLASADELTRALKRLRRSMRHCEKCSLSIDCLILTEFNAKFQTALQQVTDEWSLS